MATQPNAGAEEVRLIRLPEVTARCGISRATIYRMAAQGSFPRPIRLGGRISAWDSRKIDAWIAAHCEVQDGQ